MDRRHTATSRRSRPPRKFPVSDRGHQSSGGGALAAAAPAAARRSSALTQPPLAPGVVSGVDAHRANEKPPPLCSHCAIACASAARKIDTWRGVERVPVQHGHRRRPRSLSTAGKDFKLHLAVSANVSAATERQHVIGVDAVVDRQREHHLPSARRQGISQCNTLISVAVPLRAYARCRFEPGRHCVDATIADAQVASQ